MEKLAKQLLTGEVECDNCPGLQQLVADVKDGEVSMEEFVTILENAKMSSLKSVV